MMVGSSRSVRLLRFGVYEADLRAGELRKQGLKLKLQEKPFQILAILLERAGDVVTREELRERLWPHDTFVDFDNSLNTAMSKLREALGESAGSPRFIETLTRRGYRFVGTVEAIDSEGEVVVPFGARLEPGERVTRPAEPPVETPTDGLPAPQVPLPPVVSRRARPRATVLLLAGVAAFLAVAGYFAWNRFGPNAPAAGGRKIMLAVLPFKNLNGDPAQEYFSDGLTEEMIAQLGRLHPQRLGVIGRTSAIQYKNSTKSIAQIGRELGVQYIVEGSVRRSDGRVRITAKLIQVGDQTQLWTENYERGVADVLAIQSDVARRIAGALAVELLPRQRAALSRAAATNPEAHEAYLRGRFLWNKRSEESIKKSMAYFEEAIAKDPNYAAAHSGLADAYIVLESYSQVSGRQTFPKARQAAMKAVELDDSLGEAITSLAAIHHLQWDWTGAEREFQRAIRMNPNYATAHQWYAELLTMQARLDEALGEAQLARELDPYSAIINHVLAYNFYVMRRYDDAIEQYQRTLEIDPDFFNSRFGLANVYEQKQMYKEAVDEWQKLMRPGSAAEADEVRQEFARAGFPAALRRRHEQLVTRAKSGYVPPLLLARLSLKVGRTDEAFQWLDKAFEERRQRLGYLKVDPVYDSIRNDPRYLDLLQRIGLR